MCNVGGIEFYFFLCGGGVLIFFLKRLPVGEKCCKSVKMSSENVCSKLSVSS